MRHIILRQDEFFRVRMANLGRVAALGDSHAPKELKEEAEKAVAQMKQLNHLNAKYANEYSLAVKSVCNALEANGITILKDNKLTEKQVKQVYHFYITRLIGRISPVWLENLHDFDREADDKIYMIVRMRKGGGKARYALLPLPVDAAGRWFVLPLCNFIKKFANVLLYSIIRMCYKLN